MSSLHNDAMDVGITSAEDTSVLPHTGSSDGVDDVVDGSQRVRIKPIDTKLQLHFKQTQASGRLLSFAYLAHRTVSSGCSLCT